MVFDLAWDLGVAVIAALVAKAIIWLVSDRLLCAGS